MPAKQRRRKYGEHLSPKDLFYRYIFPQIEDVLYDYIWVDLFAGEGNLILPILEKIDPDKRSAFFSRHIFLYDIQEAMVEKSIRNAMALGIAEKIARKNIRQNDSLKNYPLPLMNKRIGQKGLKIFHITNPPYLYLGYIRKNKNVQEWEQYFEVENSGYQDLYQIALINDLRYRLQKMIYIIPSNFLYGSSVSNKIRRDFFPLYNINQSFVLENKVFKNTGTNVCICSFQRKKNFDHKNINFPVIKIGKTKRKRKLSLSCKNNYRAGGEFNDFVNKYRCENPLRFSYYLSMDEVQKNKGDLVVSCVNASVYSKSAYEILQCKVNSVLRKKIKANPLYIRTVDTGKQNGRAGLYAVRDTFQADCVVYTKAKYRTHPIQLILEKNLSHQEIFLVQDYFNTVLEYLRKQSDSEFMTTYKYSHSSYTRKYLGLTQVKKILQTFPVSLLEKYRNKLNIQNSGQSNSEQESLWPDIVLSEQPDFMKDFLKKYNL